MTQKEKVQQFDSVARERDLFMFACHDIQNGLIQWGEWVRESDGAGKYRAGLSRQGSLLVTVWRHPNQQDSIRVFEAVSEIDNIRRLRNGSESWEPLQRAIVSAQDAERNAALCCPDCKRPDQCGEQCISCALDASIVEHYGA